ncbi:hypothetical protein [Micromonospora sp. NPDC005324]|uniref:hypothetical protein n=1 Tax=Micromonospora sp. NPDC005324 TaxID=3157033 RepID=UPI0033AB93DB
MVPRQWFWLSSSGASSATASTGATIIQARIHRNRDEVRDLAYGSTAVVLRPATSD